MRDMKSWLQYKILNTRLSVQLGEHRDALREFDRAQLQNHKEDLAHYETMWRTLYPEEEMV